MARKRKAENDSMNQELLSEPPQLFSGGLPIRPRARDQDIFGDSPFKLAPKLEIDESMLKIEGESTALEVIQSSAYTSKHQRTMPKEGASGALENKRIKREKDETGFGSFSRTQPTNFQNQQHIEGSSRSSNVETEEVPRASISSLHPIIQRISDDGGFLHILEFWCRGLGMTESFRDIRHPEIFSWTAELMLIPGQKGPHKAGMEPRVFKLYPEIPRRKVNDAHRDVARLAIAWMQDISKEYFELSDTRNQSLIGRQRSNHPMTPQPTKPTFQQHHPVNSSRTSARLHPIPVFPLEYASPLASVRDANGVTPVQYDKIMQAANLFADVLGDFPDGHNWHELIQLFKGRVSRRRPGFDRYG